MWRISLANLRHKPGRFIATTLAVIVGTGFLAGALVLRDSVGPALADTKAIALQGVSVVVLPSAGNAPNGASRQANQMLQSVPASMLNTVQKVNGVSDAAGITSGPLKLQGPNDSVRLSNLIGQGWIDVPTLNPYTIVQGSAPQERGQVAIDADTARDQSIAIGATITLGTSSGAQQATVVGLTNFGTNVSYNPQGDVLVNPSDAFTYLTAGRQVYDAIYAAAQPGVSPQTLANDVARSTPGLEVQTAADYLGQQDAAQTIAEAITTGLQYFAYVALFVAIFIIYNTFTTVVTQRTQELALLRAVGASGEQIKRAIRVEAIGVGLVASAIGMAVGIALLVLLMRLVPQFKNFVGTDVAMRVSVSSVLQVLVSGTLITFLSAVVPGWRAARTPPVAAMRVVDIDRSPTSRFRIGAGSVLLIVGVGLLLLGAGISQALVVLFGTFVAFVSVLVGGPVLAHYFGRLAALPARLAGTPGHLAVENVERNARRTATTANALVIGVFLVVFVTAAGGAVRDFASTQLTKLSGSDFTVQAEQNATIPPQVVQQIPSTPGVANTAVVYGNFAPTNNGFPICAVDIQKAIDVFGLKQGAGPPLRQLTANQMAVVAFPAAGGGGGGEGGGNEIPRVGDTIPVTFSNGQTREFQAVSSYQINFSVPLCLLISQQAALAVEPSLQPVTVGVVVQSGAEEQVQNALDNEVASYSSIEVQPGNGIAQAVKNFFNLLINSVSALLGVAIVIALFGIVNTLILSSSERTREIGVLRAVGMARSQLRLMVRVEAMIVALLGTLIGMGFGLLVAFALVRPMLEQTSSGLNLPFVQLGLILLLGILIGVVASLIPAWRATRLDPLDAIRDF
ncbi:MAG: ABC transporter permease [Actinobacteria bacterium]|nr:ABC transporter permease [Actinomycetota bacterium]